MSHSVFSDDYVTVTHEPDIGVFVYTRNATPYPSADVVHAHHVAMAETLASLSPQHAGLLIDVRLATPRNDPAFEEGITRAVGTLLARFGTFAFLVKTAVGSLQLRRLSASNGIPASAVFTDEAAAKKYLATRSS